MTESPTPTEKPRTRLVKMLLAGSILLTAGNLIFMLKMGHARWEVLENTVIAYERYLREDAVGLARRAQAFLHRTVVRPAAGLGDEAGQLVAKGVATAFPVFFLVLVRLLLLKQSLMLCFPVAILACVEGVVRGRVRHESRLAPSGFVFHYVIRYSVLAIALFQVLYLFSPLVFPPLLVLYALPAGVALILFTALKHWPLEYL